MDLPVNCTVDQLTIQSCPSCKSTNISHEDEAFCEDCGHLFDVCTLDYAEHNENLGSQYQRYDSNNFNMQTDSMRRGIREGKVKANIKSYATALKLQGCEGRAFGVYEAAIKSGKFKTHHRGKTLMYASLYFAAIEKKSSITFRRFLEIDSTANIFFIGRVYKKIVSELKLEPEKLDPNSLALKMLAMINENLKHVSITFPNLNDSLNFDTIVKIALKIFCASKNAWISEGRPLAPLVAASNVIALQFVHKVNLTRIQVATLLSFQGVGSSGNKRYTEIKDLILQAFTKKHSGRRLEAPVQFYLHTSCLIDDSSDVNLDSTNACLLRSKACREAQLVSTQNATQHLKSKLAFEPSEVPFELDSDILVRERALLLGIPYSTVSSLCTRDLKVTIDQLTKAQFPPDPDDLASEPCDD